jgi:hypothetical protein
MSSEDRGLLRIAPAGYFVSFLLVATPVFDWATNITPMRPASVDWRYGVTGLLSGFLLTPLLGMALASLIAVAGNQRRHRVTVSAMSLVGGLFLVLLIPLFLLDFFQLRASMPASEIGFYDVSGFKALLKHVSCAGAFTWLGFAGLRGLPRRIRRSQSAALVMDSAPEVNV